MPVGEVLNPFFVQTSFTSEDDGYRLVEYMFGGGIPMRWRGCRDSPVGAIWLWRSGRGFKSQLSEKKAIHRSQIQDFDRANMGGDILKTWWLMGK